MPHKKRLIVCCDGTWQASDKPDAKKNVESNVTRMCRALSEVAYDEHRHEIQQVVYYQSGIGTDTMSWLSRKFAGVEGLGLNENVVEAYNFICLNYDANYGNSKTFNPDVADEIMLFGFSRGAYTVRALGGLISQIGILKKEALKDFPAIYIKYSEGKLDKDESEHMRHKVHPEDVRIKVVGVWDTVGSLGIPDAWFSQAAISRGWNKKYEFLDASLPSCVEHAFHALALDEHRQPFSPTLWHMPEPIPNRTAPELIQCWFPGVHINCGGGSSDEINDKEKQYTDFGQLSHITFAWMVDLCSPHLCFDQVYLVKFAKAHADVAAELKTKMAKCLRHKGGWAQGMINDSFDTGMAAAGSRTRAPKQYDRLNKVSTDWSKLGNNTNEYIHPSARIRIKKRFDNVGSDRVWERPTDQISLAGFQMQWNDGYSSKDEHFSGLTWVKEDAASAARQKRTIPEWKIKLSGNMKWQLDNADVTPNLEHALLVNQPELEMVRDPKNHCVRVLPPAPKESFLSNVWNSSYLFVMGKLPSAYHSWENE